VRSSLELILVGDFCVSCDAVKSSGGESNMGKSSDAATVDGNGGISDADADGGIIAGGETVV